MNASHATHPHPAKGRTTWRTLILAVGLALALGYLGASSSAVSGAAEKPENIIVVMTDDQRFDELASMPKVRKLLGRQGARFQRAYATYPLCCPARVSILTGEYMHNHGVRGNGGPDGGWKQFATRLNPAGSIGEERSIAVRLKEAGYATSFIGKYMNGYLAGKPKQPVVPPGWDHWFGKPSSGLGSPGYAKYGSYYDFTIASKEPDSEALYRSFGTKNEDYASEVFARRGLDQLDTLLQGEDPFFLNVWHFAPHYPFLPSREDRGSWRGRKLPKARGFNERDISDKPKWLRKLAAPMDAGTISAVRSASRRRMEQMMPVDRMVGRLIQRLRAAGELDNTYIFFTSDNGYLLGEHRVPTGKALPYEPSARVPLLVRGPGVSAGGVSKELVSHLDMTQSFLEIATGSEDAALDGRSLLPFAAQPKLRTRRPILLEADSGKNAGESDDVDLGDSIDPLDYVAKLRGLTDLEQEPGSSLVSSRLKFTSNVPAYRGLRVSRYLYVVYGNGSEELYDMKRDPWQLKSKHGAPRYQGVKEWMSSWLARLVECKGQECRDTIPAPPKPGR